MEKKAFNYYKKTYDELKEVYDIPTISSNFYQKDFHAKEYCDKIDFVTLIIPFMQSKTGTDFNSVLVKNELVSYVDMYSEVYGTTVDEDSTFLESAIQIAKRCTGNRNLKFEDIAPIAFVENKFNHNGQMQMHRGIAFVGLIQTNSSFNNLETSIKNINDQFLFTNPHNEVIFDLTKAYIRNYKMDQHIIDEKALARKQIKNKKKEKKEQYLSENKIPQDNYNSFIKRIVNDTLRYRPSSIIDIACGDDDIIYEFVGSGAKPKKLFANDVALDYIINYHTKHPKYKSVNFSNFNAVDAHFKCNSFDVVLCKNLLHHTASEELPNLIKNLLRISKSYLMIVEILNVDEQNASGKRLHNEFYKKIMKETHQKNYLTYQEQIELLKSQSCEIVSEEQVETENGIYSYIWIAKNDAK